MYSEHKKEDAAVTKCKYLIPFSVSRFYHSWTISLYWLSGSSRKDSAANHNSNIMYNNFAPTMSMPTSVGVRLAWLTLQC